MKVSIKKWGNSASLRIPSVVLKAAHMSLDQTVEVKEENGRIIIEPVHDDEVDLASLLASITEDNLHAEIDTGVPQGKEIW